MAALVAVRPSNLQNPQCSPRSLRGLRLATAPNAHVQSHWLFCCQPSTINYPLSSNLTARYGSLRPLNMQNPQCSLRAREDLRSLSGTALRLQLPHNELTIQQITFLRSSVINRYSNHSEIDGFTRLSARRRRHDDGIRNSTQLWSRVKPGIFV